MKSRHLHGIHGLTFEPSFLTKEETERLLHDVDAGGWRTVDSGQRIQEHGITQTFGTRHRGNPMKYNGPLPPWSTALVERLIAEGRAGEVIRSVLALEYTDGRGIKPHVDSQHYGNDVFIVSLGEPCVMTFQKKGGGEEHDVPLASGSLLHMREQARHAWVHGIKTGQIVKRRVSVSLRSVKDKYLELLGDVHPPAAIPVIPGPPPRQQE